MAMLSVVYRGQELETESSMVGLLRSLNDSFVHSINIF